MRSHRESLGTSHGFQIPFHALQMTVFNPVNQWLYMRVGALDKPDALGADITIEPYASKSIVLSPVSEFGVTLGATGAGSADNAVQLVDFALFQTTPQTVAYAIFYDVQVPVSLAANVPFPVEPFRFPIDAKNPWNAALVPGDFVNLVPDTSGTLAFLHKGLTASKVICYLYKAYIYAEGSTRLALSVEGYDNAGNLIATYFVLRGNVDSTGNPFIRWDFDGTINSSHRQGLQLFPDNVVPAGGTLRVYNRGAANIAIGTWSLYEFRYQP